jgi:hypothetical protein
VAWLYENGLTATSSYTILQAALSCPPDTAKEIVYSHPAWAGAEPDTGIDNLSYTTETLEPEPEPDPTFELDDWAEQIEEEEQAPVYGEEGFQADPDAGASPPAYARESQAPTGADGTILLDPARSGSDEPTPANDQTNALNDSGGFEGDASEPVADTGKDVAQEKPAEPSSVSPDAEITKNAPSGEPGLADSDQAAAADPSAPEPADAAPAQPDPEPEQPAMAAIAMPPPLVYQPLPDIQITPPVAPVAPAAPLFALPQRDRRPPPPLFPPANTADQVVTADDGPTTPLPDSDPAPLPDTPPEQPRSEPALVANGLDTTADQKSAILEKMPETPPTATVENTVSLRSGMQSAMKHEDAEPQDETVEPPSEEGGESAPTDLEPDLTPLNHGQEPEPAPQDNEEELEPAPRDNEQEPEPVPQDDGEEPEAPLAAVMDNTGDLPADMPQAVGQVEAEPQDEMVDSPDEEAGESAPTDWAQELPPLEEEAEDDDPDAYASMADEGDDGRDGMEVDEDAAPRPQKRMLLDRSGEADEGGLPGGDAGELPLGDTPEELAAAAKKLGVDFRNGDQSDAGVDPEMAKAAKELGISFREGTDTIPPLDDEAAIEAQKLGISFRGGDTVSNKSKKPKLVKYLPFGLAVIVLTILLLLGVTFAGDAISWFGG